MNLANQSSSPAGIDLPQDSRDFPVKLAIIKLEAFAGSLSSVGAFISGVSLMAMILVIVFEVVMRKFFNSPTIWSIEFVTFMMIWFGFMTLAVIQKQGRHVYVDLLVGRLDEKTKKMWLTTMLLVTLTFILILTWFTWKDFIEAWETGEKTSTIWGPPIWPLKLALPIGGTIMAIQLVADFFGSALRLVEGSWTDDPDLTGEDSSTSTARYGRILVLFSVLAGGSFWLLTNKPMLGLICLLLVLLFAGVPLFSSLGLAGMAGLYLYFGEWLGISQIPGIIDAAMGNFTIAALPPFILCGFLLSRSGAGEELYDLFSKWVGRLPGGLGIATILSCAFFAAISISSVATVATIGMISIPALLKRKYDPAFCYGLVGSGSTLGIMIPPSGTMILYAMVTEESLGQLLIAGLLPGLLLSGLFVVYTVIYAVRNQTYEKEELPSWDERWRATGTAMWTIAVPAIIIIGIFSGVFTVLECGAVAGLYTFLMVLGRRKITLREIPQTLVECGINGGFILIIIAGAMAMGRYITLSQVPQMTMEAITAMQLSPGMVIFMIICLLTLLGLFLEVASVMLITLPIIYPVIISLGFNGVWFAVLMTIAMELAIITPPVGMNLYVIQGFTNDKLATIIRGMIPFFFLMVLGMLIIYLFPQISLFLPQFVGF